MGENDKNESVQKLNKNPKAPQEYEIARFVLHIGKGAILKYEMQYFGYTPAEDNVELPSNIPQCFLSRYWRRIREKSVWERSTRTITNIKNGQGKSRNSNEDAYHSGGQMDRDEKQDECPKVSMQRLFLKHSYGNYDDVDHDKCQSTRYIKVEAQGKYWK